MVKIKPSKPTLDKVHPVRLFIVHSLVTATPQKSIQTVQTLIFCWWISFISLAKSQLELHQSLVLFVKSPFCPEAILLTSVAWGRAYAEMMVDHFRKSRVENIIISRACGVIVVIFNTVDGQIIQTPHPWVVGYPLSPKISTLWFRIFVADLRVWFISSIRERTKPKKTLKLGVRGVIGWSRFE